MGWLHDLWESAKAEIRTIGEAHPDNRSPEPPASSHERLPHDPPVDPGVWGDHYGGW